MTIAVDFDGTIVEHRYPEIGKEKPFAIDTLKKLIAQRHQLILWSVREGKLLDDPLNGVVSGEWNSMPSTGTIRRKRVRRTTTSHES